MTVLLLETATEFCGVALVRDGEMLGQIIADGPHQHARFLNVFIDQLLEEAQLKASDLDAIGLSEGPGSYTSLRVGAAMAKGLCLALPHLKLYPLSSLRALARQATKEQPMAVIATQQSRRNEVYALLREPGSTADQQAQALAVDDPAFTDFIARHSQLVICGAGTEKLAEEIRRPQDIYLPDLQSQAIFLYGELLAGLAIGLKAADVASFEPLYLKPPFVTVSKKRSLL